MAAGANPTAQQIGSLFKAMGERLGAALPSAHPDVASALSQVGGSWLQLAGAAGCALIRTEDEMTRHVGESQPVYRFLSSGDAVLSCDRQAFSAVGWDLWSNTPVASQPPQLPMTAMALQTAIMSLQMHIASQPALDAQRAAGPAAAAAAAGGGTKKLLAPYHRGAPRPHGDDA
jgi:hypothetical protein